MKNVKLIALLLLLSTVISLFTGCLIDNRNDESNGDRLHIENEYEAEIYDNIYNSGMVLESFLNDETKNNIYIVENMDTYNTIFNEGAIDVNFDEEIIYLHFFRRLHGDPHYIDEISIKDNIVHFYIKYVNLGMIGARYDLDVVIGYFAIKIKKTDSVDFEFHIDCNCKKQDFYS